MGSLSTAGRDSLPPPGIPPLLDLLRLWFGISRRVGPVEYAASGVALMLLKYGIETLVIWFYTSNWYPPWAFLNPVLSARMAVLQPAPEWLGWALFAWTLPFLWVAISMSVRRAADAGASPWLGLVVLVPVVNLFFMVAMCFASSKPGEQWTPQPGAASEVGRSRSAILGVGVSLMVGALMLLCSVYLFSTYGASLFVGTPLLMGATGSYVYNRAHRRSYGSSTGIAVVAVLCAASALLLFALEGVICVAMAAPLFLPLGALGGVLGKAIADSTRGSENGLLTVLVILPLLPGVESMLRDAPEREVLTAVEIDAPPDVVWEHIVDFPDLPEPAAWYFRYGIACPQRARIVDQGPGATRFCEFTTGTFVEPITAWEPPLRLAFDVTDQPAPMFELSPYRHVHPPHLEGYLRCNRGEFLLVPLPGGRTRLEGRTWYKFQMFPQGYWTLWSDLLVHRIHQRVLLHIKRLSERQ